MLSNDLFAHIFSFFLVYSSAMHSKKSFNMIKNIYLISLQKILD